MIFLSSVSTKDVKLNSAHIWQTVVTQIKKLSYNFWTWSEFDTLSLYLYSCSYHPEEDHTSGRTMSVMTV
jgi:hypothetical protein